MADVKWIKILTDIFDDEKVLLIETLPEADSIIVIWFKLLCLAGKQNNSGVFMLNDKMPYNEKMFATIFRRKESVIELAFSTFVNFGMIEIIEGTVTIPNWGKHQTLDKIESRNEYMRTYMQEYRTKQKQIAECKVNSKVNGKVNVNSLEEELDKKEKRKEKKSIYGEFKKVKLTDEEFERLIKEFGEDKTLKAIKKVDEYKEQSGKKYNNDNLALRKWGFVEEPKQAKTKVGVIPEGIENDGNGIYDYNKLFE